MMRVGYSALMLGLHGWARFFSAVDYVVSRQPWTFIDLVQGLGLPFASAFAVASAMSESVCVVLIALGLWTRAAATLIAIDMMVAIYNEASKGDSIELPALYFLGAMLFAVTGGGRYSVDAFRGGRAMTASRIPDPASLIPDP